MQNTTANILTVVHTLILIYQLISLNVAINSYDQSLLTLLVSNQFVEIKGSVFKKFEKDNLFQITCAGADPSALHSRILMRQRRYRRALSTPVNDVLCCISQSY
jgi:hypothetical protein